MDAEGGATPFLGITVTWMPCGLCPHLEALHAVHSLFLVVHPPHVSQRLNIWLPPRQPLPELSVQKQGAQTGQYGNNGKGI